jgi:pimeloyl-ACP methyl ester carboxylesterase
LEVQPVTEVRLFEGFHGVKLAADVGGYPGHTPIIFMHGGGQTRRSWGTAAAALIARGYHVVSVDLRGHGESGWPDDADYSLDAFVFDLCALMRALPRPPVVVGASLGGVIGLLAAGEQKSPAAALVLVDIAPDMDRQGAANITGFMSAYPNGFATVEEAAEAVAAYLPHRPRPKDTSGLRKNLRVGDDGRFYWHWDPRLTRSTHARVAEMPARMNQAAQHVSVPTLLVRGEHSELISEQAIASFRALLPGAEYVDVKGARHMVAGDENSLFNQAVVDFLSRHVPSTQD